MADRTQAIEIARALSDPLRMAMLEHLMQGPAAVSELVSLVEAGQPNVSNHLNVLRGAGLIRAVKSGRQRIYEIRDAGAAQLIEALFAAAGPSARAIKPTPHSPSPAPATITSPVVSASPSLTGCATNRRSLRRRRCAP